MLKAYDLGKENVVVMEVRLDKLFEVRSGKKKFVAPNKYPSMNRDIAIVIKKEVSSKDVIECIKRSDRGLIKNVTVFDEYIGEHLEEGMKSLALTITYASEEGTLKDDVVNSAEQKVLRDLEKSFLAKLRN